MYVVLVLGLLGASAAATASTASTASTEDPPPPLAVDEPPPVLDEPPPVEAQPVPGPGPNAPGPRTERDEQEPVLPGHDDLATGFGGDACWGSTIGCGAGGCLPGVGTAVGAGILATSISAGLAEGGCGGVVLIIAGAVGAVAIGVPSAVLLGPCACGSAAAGGVVSAMLNEREVGPVLVGSIPGAAVASVGTAGVVWGLLALDGAADLTVPLTILGVSVALQTLAGPITVAGISIADGMAEPPPSTPAPPSKPAPERREGPVVAMRF